MPITTFRWLRLYDFAEVEIVKIATIDAVVVGPATFRGSHTTSRFFLLPVAPPVFARTDSHEV